MAYHSTYVGSGRRRRVSPNFKNSKSGAAAPDFEFLKFGESRYNDWVGGLGMGIVWGGGEDWEERGGVWVQGLGGGCGEVVGGRGGGGDFKKVGKLKKRKMKKIQN